MVLMEPPDSADPGPHEKRRPIFAIFIALLAVICGLLLVLPGWGVWQARQTLLADSRVTTDNMARALASQAENALKIAGTVLAEVVARVEYGNPSGAETALLQRILRERVAGLPDLHGIFVYDNQGRWVVTSLDRPAQGNNADREYFKFHQSRRDSAVHVGAPIRSRSTGVWVVPVSRRIEHRDGSFAGVALVTMKLDFFGKFYDSFDIGSDGAILLALDDGTLLFRRPVNTKLVGTSIANGPVFQLYRKSGPVGSAMLVAKIDKVERLYSYRHLESFPLLVATALSKKEILGHWRSASLQLMAGVLLVLAAITWVGWRLARQMLLREQLERQLLAAQTSLREHNAALQVQALVDGLTGLANRRHFEQSLLREYGRAARNGTRLALLMLDVDQFKKYNDRYGHQAGDECLRQVAQAVGLGNSRAADLAARYGGEEFVIVLPDTDLAGALAVAEKVRAAVEALGIEHADNPGRAVTISVGVHAASPPHEGGDPALLLARADQLLYRAKSEGRNRVCG